MVGVRPFREPPLESHASPIPPPAPPRPSFRKTYHSSPQIPTLYTYPPSSLPPPVPRDMPGDLTSFIYDFSTLKPPKTALVQPVSETRPHRAIFSFDDGLGTESQTPARERSPPSTSQPWARLTSSTSHLSEVYQDPHSMDREKKLNSESSSFPLPPRPGPRPAAARSWHHP